MSLKVSDHKCLFPNGNYTTLFGSQTKTLIAIKDTDAASVDEGIFEIKVYSPSQNHPNPFNPSTTINYQLPQSGFVTLKVYDILGREVATLVSEEKSRGRYSVNFSAKGGSASSRDALNLASGVYIYQLRVNEYVSSKKMMLVK